MDISVIKIKAFALCLLSIVTHMQTQAQINTDFQLGANGVTVECDNAALGETGEINSITYTKRSKDQITTANAPTTCTSGIVNMDSLFLDATTFDGDISSWDVSDVTSMISLFNGAARFNKDISKWDVSSVQNISGLFANASDFNRDISFWDVSSVDNMYGMFYNAASFNQAISSWDVSSVTDMRVMFLDANVFSQDLSTWCVAQIGSQPNNFGNSGGTNPVWGTCPVLRREIYGDAGWRLLSLPITGGTVSDLSDDTAIQGVTGGDNPSASANFYLYDDSGEWEVPTDVSTVFGDGKGFAVYFYDNANAGSSALPVRLDAAGSEPSADVTVALNITPESGSSSAFTLVGNPFSSNFSTNTTDMVPGGGGIQNNIYFWNDATGSFSVQDRTTPYIVRPWQGFWVQLNFYYSLFPDLTFKTTGKTTSDATGSFFSKTVATNNRGDINFTLSSATTYDEAIRISFRDEATTDYDLDDASKMVPLLTEYATMAFYRNDRMKAVESLPYDLQEEITIPAHLELVGVSGSFTFAWDGLESIPEEWELTLHDYEQELSMNMRQESAYTFTAASSSQAKRNPQSMLTGTLPETMKLMTEETRFGITIRPASVNTTPNEQPVEFELSQNYPNPFNPSTTIRYTIQESGQVRIAVYTLMGQKVATLVDGIKQAGAHNVRWNAAGHASGMYYYQLEANGQVITKKMTLIK
jgi:surface protein